MTLIEQLELVSITQTWNRQFAKLVWNNLDTIIAALKAAEWRPIEEAPKDGTRLLVAKYGWSTITGDLEPGSTEWKARLFDKDAPKEYRLWWMTMAWWSDAWDCWFDGQEPSGLSGPTHYKPLGPGPEGEG